MVHHIVKQPLSSTFMLATMLGFFISIFYVWPISLNWGFAFAVLFAFFFVAAVYNFTHAPDEDHLAVHEPERHLRHTRQYQK